LSAEGAFNCFRVQRGDGVIAFDTARCEECQEFEDAVPTAIPNAVTTVSMATPVDQRERFNAVPSCFAALTESIWERPQMGSASDGVRVARLTCA
jgi:hypothetical protein